MGADTRPGPGSSTRSHRRCASPAGALRSRGDPISDRDVFEAREALILSREDAPGSTGGQAARAAGAPRDRTAAQAAATRRIRAGTSNTCAISDSWRRTRRSVSPTLSTAKCFPGNSPGCSSKRCRPSRRPGTWTRTATWTWDGLLAAFQDFFRQNSEHWVQRAQYTEAGPQLVLQAFLHRVLTGKGRIEREYALGSRRVDLLVVWPGGQGRPTGSWSSASC